MACTEIVVKVVGDSEFVTQQVQTVAQKADEVKQQVDAAAQSATSAQTSEASAQDYATQAQDALSQIQAHKPTFITNDHGSTLSTETDEYNFVGDGVTVTQTAPNKFDISVPKFGDMFKANYDPTGVIGDAFDRANHHGEIPTSVVTGLDAQLASKLDAGEFTQDEIKRLYEANANTNVFTDAEKDKLFKADEDADMDAATYDPNAVEGDVFDPANQDFSSFDDRAVLGVHGGKIFDTGLRASGGSLDTDANSVTIGDHTMSSAGENIMWRNERTKGIWSAPWIKVTRDGQLLPTVRLYTPDPMYTKVMQPTQSGKITNPQFSFTSAKNSRIWSFHLLPAEEQTNVHLRVHYNNLTIWEFDIGDFTKDVPFKFDLDKETTPNDVKVGLSYQVDITSPDGDVVLYGDDTTGVPYFSLDLRDWIDTPLGDGGAGTGKGDMLKAVYDTNNDGRVDWAELASYTVGHTSAEPLSYYGKNKSGDIGYYTLKDLAVNTVEFTDQDRLLGKDDLVDFHNAFIYRGDTGTTVSLPELKFTTPGENQTVTIINNSDNYVSLGITVQGADDIANIDGSILTISKGDAATFISHRKERHWYLYAHSGYQKVIEKLVKDVAAHETAIEGHGTQLAAHASAIQSTTNTANQALTNSRNNAESIVTARKNSVTGITLEPNQAAKTITLKLTSEHGVVDSGLINLAGWFDGGGTQPGVDHIIYYGFSVNPPLDEAEILRLGTKKTVPTIAGLDIEMTRTSQVSSHMWVWLPDNAGVIKGFTFGGFLSVWQHTALTVSGVPGQFYTSPNPTSAQTVKFEVTQ